MHSIIENKFDNIPCFTNYSNLYVWWATVSSLLNITPRVIIQIANRQTYTQNTYAILFH